MTDTMNAAPPLSEGNIVSPQVETYEDYWGSDETVQWYLPDGKQYFVIRPMNEGAKTKFQKKTNRDIVVSQRNDDARIGVDPAGDRHELIKVSVVDWFLVQKLPDGSWSPAPFASRSLDQWLEKAPPHIVEKLEYQIRMVNPWLQADMTVEFIEEEIDRLEKLLKQKKAEAAGEGVSANK